MLEDHRQPELAETFYNSVFCKIFERRYYNNNNIFVESSVSKKNIEALQEGAKSKGWDVRIGGTLFADAMGESGTYEGTYVGMMDHNATVITRALGGTAPEKGMQGKLGSKETKEDDESTTSVNE